MRRPEKSISGNSYTDRLRPFWASVRPGDWFLFYSRGFFNAVARVAATRDSKPIAEAVWGSVIDGLEYRTLVVFDRVESADVAAWPLREFLGSACSGFGRPGAPRQKRINDQDGSRPMSSLNNDSSNPNLGRSNPSLLRRRPRQARLHQVPDGEGVGRSPSRGALPSAPLCDFHEAAKRIREAHLSDRATVDFEQARARDQIGEDARQRSRRSAVPPRRGTRVPVGCPRLRSSPLRRRRHPPLLALELVDSADSGIPGEGSPQAANLCVVCSHNESTPEALPREEPIKLSANRVRFPSGALCRFPCVPPASSAVQSQGPLYVLRRLRRNRGAPRRTFSEMKGHRRRDVGGACAPERGRHPQGR